jgi:hypothetical protein
VVREALRGDGEEMRSNTGLRNSSQDQVIANVVLTDTCPISSAVRGGPAARMPWSMGG